MWHYQCAYHYSLRNNTCGSTSMHIIIAFTQTLVELSVCIYYSLHNSTCGTNSTNTSTFSIHIIMANTLIHVALPVTISLLEREASPHSEVDRKVCIALHGRLWYTYVFCRTFITQRICGIFYGFNLKGNSWIQ